MSSQTAKPSAKQLAYLRALAQSRGETFAYPSTSAEASREIRRLRTRRPSTRAERRAEHSDVIRELQEQPEDACRVELQHEARGYGIGARWAHTPEPERGQR